MVKIDWQVRANYGIVTTQLAMHVAWVDQKYTHSYYITLYTYEVHMRIEPRAAHCEVSHSLQFRSACWRVNILEGMPRCKYLQQQ